MKTIGRDFGDTARKVYAVASGALGNGKAVIVNSDGTVTKVQIVSSSVSASTGSTSTFESARCDSMDATYDTVRDRIFIVFRDSANSNYGTGVVGTVSGTSISFGTPVVFNSANSSFMRTGFSTQDIDGNSHNKCIIIYRDAGNSGYGNAIGATIAADDSVAFTSENQWSNNEAVEEIDLAMDTSDSAFGVITYKSSSDDQGNAQVLGVSSSSLNSYTHSAFNAQETNSSSIAYDASLNKFIIAYSDGGSSDRGEAVIATRSSTSLSYTGTTTFDSGSSGKYASSIRVTGDGSGTIVIGYQNYASSNRPHIIAATTDGSSFSFGSRVSCNSEGSSEVNTVDYNPDTGKYTYAFGTDTGPGKYVIATLSGTTISISSVVQFENGNVQDGLQVGVAYTEGGQQVFCFADAQTAGKAFILQGAYTKNTPNLTSENYIGITPSAYPDGAAVEIQTKGAVNEEQSGLTAGQSYYVQTDGTLSTTAGDPSVFAGTAVSATKIIVKG